jgi:hypothetical protein
MPPGWAHGRRATPGGAGPSSGRPASNDAPAPGLSTSALRLTGLALLAAALAGCAHAGRGEDAGSGIRFVSDDFSGALARARAENKPLFVDAWAPGVTAASA